MCAGSCCEAKTETDSNDITEHPHDDKPRPYVCTVCDKQFTIKRDLNRHKELHTGKKLYSCTHCKKCFATQHYLRIHMNVHSSKYKCTECGKCFTGNRDLTLHRKSHSAKKLLYKCRACSKKFAASCDLVRHKRYCAELFRSSSDSKHQILAETVAEPYSCRLCFDSFSQLSELLSHLQNHRC